MANGDVTDEYLPPPPQQQQPPPQTFPLSRPTAMEQYGPIAGGALLAYLNAITSPRLAGANRAILQGVTGGLEGYGQLENYAQQMQAARQRQEALSRLGPQEQIWAAAGVPTEKIFEHQMAGAVPIQTAVQTLQSYISDPSVPDQQRALAHAMIQSLAGRTTPLSTKEFNDMLGKITKGGATHMPWTAEGLYAAAAAETDPGKKAKLTAMAEAAAKEKQAEAAAGVSGKIQVKQAPGAPPQVAPEKTSEAEVKIGLDAYNKAFNQYVKTHPITLFGMSADEVAAGAKKAGKKAQADEIARFRAGAQPQPAGQGAAPAGGGAYPPLPDAPPPVD